MLWLALTVLAAGAGLLVALPFLRRRTDAELPTTPAEIYKSQLDDLAKDEAVGDVDAATAANLRIEIERRILEAPNVTESAAAAASFDRVTAAAVAAIVVLGSAILYAATGSPSIGPSASNVSADRDDAQSLADIDAAIDRLRARLEQAPSDAEGWRMLGWSYFETGRYDQSIEAYRRAVSLAPAQAGYRSALAEALTWANGGTVSAEARDEFRAVIAGASDDERARYCLALAKAQGGDLRAAVQDWIAAIGDAAPDSTWAPVMRADAETAAREAGISLNGRLPPAPEGASAATEALPHPPALATRTAPSPEAQQDMVDDMIGGLERRLANNPRDADGWVLLMRSRMVMGQPDRARAALSNSLEAFQGDRDTQQRLRAVASELDVPSGG